jgi:peptidoglycan/xylan/chitin deacetylase (PgdA/CDA1 family)
MLMECYSYLPFEERVRTTSATLLEALRFVASHPGAVKEAVEKGRTVPDRIAVRYRLDAFDEPIEIPTREPRTLEGRPTAVKVRHLSRFVGTAVVDRPPAYLVPPAVAAHLELHGLDLEDPPATLEVEVATAVAEASEAGRKILEDAKVGALSVAWRRETRRPPAGSRLVRTDQPRGPVAVYFCEPESDDGAVENELVPAPTLGAEFPIARAFPPGSSPERKRR